MRVVKHLTIKQARMLREFTDASDSDILAIQLACDVTKEAATEFFETAKAGDVARCIAEIMEISGLSEEAQFQGAAGDDVVDAREAV